MAGTIPGGGRAKPHALCIPYPAQGHINPMLKMAKLLHHQGFHITFVHTEFNYHRLQRQPTARSSVQDLPAGFRFETMSDGLPLSAPRATPHELVAMGASMDKNCPATFRDLLSKLCDGTDPEVPPVSCVVSDSVMSFTVDAAEELGLPVVFLWTPSACSLLGCLQFPQLIESGFVPLKDESCLTNGYLDTIIDWIPGMKSIRLRDLPTFLRTTDRDDIMLTFCIRETSRARKASAVVFNTFEPLEHDVLEGLSAMLPRIYPVGPLNLLLGQVQPGNDRISKIGCSFWEEDRECLDWLDSRKPRSVIYINFGSITTLTTEQLAELAWGLANSQQDFLWVIRPDLVAGESAVLPPEFAAETRGRGLVARWAPQEEVLSHPSVGGFLTHCGWNSILESISNGVPVLCWPLGADQPTNCLYCCTEWGIGMEVDVKRGEVEVMVRELMGGEKGRAMRDKAEEWKRRAKEAAGPCGSSRVNFDRMVRDMLLPLEKSKVSNPNQNGSA